MVDLVTRVVFTRMLMDADTREQLLTGCLKHMAEDELPAQFPQSVGDVRQWLAEATADRPYDEEATAAWTELRELAMIDPETAWPLILELIARSPEESLSAIAAGPLGTFLWRHDAHFADRIEHEITSNPKFRDAYSWTRHADGEHSFMRGRG